MDFEPYFYGWGFLVPILLGGLTLGLPWGASLLWGHAAAPYVPLATGLGLALGGWICWAVGGKLDNEDFRYLEGDRVGRSWLSVQPRPVGSGSPHALFFIPMHWWGMLAMLAAIPVGIFGLPLDRLAHWAHLPYTAPVEAPVPTPTPEPRLTAPMDAQQAAIRRYPQLGIAGSRFNRAFLDLCQNYRSQRPELFQDPNWPTVVANEVARTLPRSP